MPTYNEHPANVRTSFRKGILKMIAILPLLLGTNLLNAQIFPQLALQDMAGKWEGALTYADYGDDQSKTTLKCNLVIEVKKSKAIFNFSFIEPNGSVVTDKAKIRIKESGRIVEYQGKYRVLEFEERPDKNSWILKISTSGKDNNKPAELQQLINFSINKFSITKQVKYAGSEAFFERNGYMMERVE